MGAHVCTVTDFNRGFPRSTVAYLRAYSLPSSLFYPVVGEKVADVVGGSGGLHLITGKLNTLL